MDPYGQNPLGGGGRPHGYLPTGDGLTGAPGNNRPHLASENEYEESGEEQNER